MSGLPPMAYPTFAVGKARSSRIDRNARFGPASAVIGARPQCGAHLHFDLSVDKEGLQSRSASTRPIPRQPAIPPARSFVQEEAHLGKQPATAGGPPRSMTCSPVTRAGPSPCPLERETWWASCRSTEPRLRSPWPPESVSCWSEAQPRFRCPPQQPRPRQLPPRRLPGFGLWNGVAEIVCRPRAAPSWECAQLGPTPRTSGAGAPLRLCRPSRPGRSFIVVPSASCVRDLPRTERRSPRCRESRLPRQRRGLRAR